MKLQLVLGLTTVLIAAPALAGEGHSHSQPPTPPQHNATYVQYAVQPSRVPGVNLEVRYTISSWTGRLVSKKVVGRYRVGTIPSP